MGQASIDLPDPLEQPSPVGGGTPKNADDLLSQLAGDEIDRMLAEAGIERVEGREGETREAEDKQPGVPGETAGEEALQAAADVSRQLNELFAELNRNAEAMETEPEAEPVTEAAEEEEPAVAELVVTPEELEKVLSAAPSMEEDKAARGGARDRNGNEEVVSVGSAAAKGQAAGLAIEEPVEGKFEWVGRMTGWCVRPLVWMNAPMESCPPAVRDALGKVALVTLVNAVAVLVYVLVFRS